MRKNKHTYLKDQNDLLGYFKKKISNTNRTEIIIICAGHFMLIPNKDDEGVIPGIFEEETSEKYKASKNVIGLFPQYTWELGCKIVKMCAQQSKQSKLSLLINDWQLVPKDNERLPSKPNRFREAFYKRFTDLPKLYKKLLHKYSLNFEDDVYRNADGHFYLREVGLWDRFKRKMKSMKKNIQIFHMCNLSLNKNGDVSIERGEEGSFELIKNSRANCSSGIAQMMIDISHHLKNQHKRITFINLMPTGCNGPANAASRTAINILGVEAPELKLRMINVFFEVYGVLNEEDFYNESYGDQVSAREYKSENYN